MLRLPGLKSNVKWGEGGGELMSIGGEVSGERWVTRGQDVACWLTLAGGWLVGDGSVECNPTGDVP